VSAGDVELRQIKELIELMERHGLLEVELFEEGRKIRLKKAPDPVAAPAVSSEVAPVSHAGGEVPRAAPAGIDEVHSPMVGTFYRAPSPDADPFIEEGDRVNEGDVLCLIEAMKVMNEIKAESAGTIEKIVVENGQAVEYGEVLFHLRPE
jgi:acetyl-CoA carboxylase biotin carboxyl carrier protein